MINIEQLSELMDLQYNQISDIKKSKRQLSKLSITHPAFMCKYIKCA